MANIQNIRFDADLQLLICVTHRTGIHPSKEALLRHLRGPGHHCKGATLKEAVAALCDLPLKSVPELNAGHPPIDAQPIEPINSLAISPGWSCRQCGGHFLTTSAEIRDRHVSAQHQQRASSHSAHCPLWDVCTLQTLFSMTGERRYFRVAGIPLLNPQSDQTGNAQQHARAQDFLTRLRAQREKCEAAALDAAQINPDPAAEDGASELWMKKLGLDRYIAGLRKDEMADSYRVREDHDDVHVVRGLQEASARVLRETWQWCQRGNDQRLTDPQAARISKYWDGADPEHFNRAFRRGLGQDTLAEYIRHWTEAVAFMYHGWSRSLFPRSMQELADTSENGNWTDRARGSGFSDSSAGRPARHLTVDDYHQRFFDYTELQDTCLKDISQLISSWRPRTSSYPTEPFSDDEIDQLKDPVVDLATAMLQQYLPNSPFRSPLLAYCAMLSIHSRHQSWQEPGSFNHHLSALVYCGQLWTFRIACRAVDNLGTVPAADPLPDDGRLDQELDSLMRRFFTNTVSRPLGYVLLWRRRLFSIAPITMVNRPAAWNLEKTAISYRGISVTMDEIRSLCSHVVQRSKRLLYSELMFAADYIPRIIPKHLAENDSERTSGWWFGQHPQNAQALQGSQDILATHVSSTPDLCALYLADEDGEEGSKTLRWRPNAIRLYRQLAQDFLQTLAVLVHIGAGPPARAPEFLTPMWYNTERLRHIQLRYGKVLIHLTEHKMMNTTGKNVNNIRFLPTEAGELLVNYLVYVVPVLESMTWQEGGRARASPYLWSDAEGKRWSPDRFGAILTAACRRAGVPELGVAVWRQMSSAIINTHFDQAERDCLHIAHDIEEPEHAGDEDEADELPSTLVSMSNHSLRTHRHAYANVSPFANVWDGKLLKSHWASEVWARFFGLEGEGPQSTDSTTALSRHKRAGSDTLYEQGLASKLLRIGQQQPKRHWTGPALLQQLRQLYRKNDLQWRSEEQQQAMQLVANHAPEVLLVLATGAGKSVMFMLGSSLPNARTTIVIVPLVLLRLDLLRRCRALGQNPIVWSSSQDLATGTDGAPTLLFVSVEVAARPAFRQYTRRLYDLGHLERVMIDECHLVLTSAHYRRHMVQLSELRQLQVPFVYMTATLPPRLETTLFHRHYIGAVSMVRGCTRRSNIQYCVEYIESTGGQEWLAYLCHGLAVKWERSAWAGDTKARAMVFVRSCGDAERVAELLDCPFYHSEVGSTQEKEARLSGWTNGDSGSPFLACTTAAGAGVDYPHVRWVVHIGEPYGLIDFSQESGRGGRDGEVAGSVVFLCRDPQLAFPSAPTDHPDPVDWQNMYGYLSGWDCRRICLGRELDSAQYHRRCSPDELLCDVCESMEKEGRHITKQLAGAEQDSAQQTLTPDDSGLIRLRRHQMQVQYEMDRYLQQLSQVQGRCMLCRVLRWPSEWTHAVAECPRAHRQHFFASKGRILNQQGRHGWIRNYAACFRCGQPQSICQGWKKGQAECTFRDLVFPAVWALWEVGGYERRWLQSHFEAVPIVESGDAALAASGRTSEFGGGECILGVRILAQLLERWSSEREGADSGDGDGGDRE